MMITTIEHEDRARSLWSWHVEDGKKIDFKARYSKEEDVSLCSALYNVVSPKASLGLWMLEKCSAGV
jgi:hypothetical protein